MCVLARYAAGCSVSVMRNRFFMPLAIAIAACGDTHGETERCAEPERCLIRRTELEGNCGPQDPVVCEDGPLPDDCVRMVAKPIDCFIEGTVACERPGLIRKWWLDGKGGKWRGEETLFLGSLDCSSRYALEIEPR